MKVICIQDKWRTFLGPSTTPDPKFGEICTVSKSWVNIGVPVYNLLEYSHQIGGYCQSCFIPLSEIDEMELVNEKAEVIS